MRSPTISADAGDIQQIINDIHGITDKPPLGQAPGAVKSSASTGYSAAVTAVARVFVEASEHGDSFDPQFSVAELREKSGLTAVDMDDAIHELRDLVKERFGSVRPVRDGIELRSDADSKYGFACVPSRGGTKTNAFVNHMSRSPGVSCT